MTGKRSEYAEPLLIEWFARRLRFDRLAAALPGDLYPPYLLVGVALFIEYGVFDVYNHFVTEKSTLVTDPGSLGIGVGVLFAVVALRRLEASRREAIEDLHKLDYGETASDTEGRLFSSVKKFLYQIYSNYSFYFRNKITVLSRNQGIIDNQLEENKQISRINRWLYKEIDISLIIPQKSAGSFTPAVSIQSKRIAYLFGINLYFIHTFGVLGWKNLVEIQGRIVPVFSIFLFCSVYIPIIVDVIIMCLGTSISFPRQIVRANPSLFYHSPRKFSGLKSVGKALRQSYFLYAVGLLAYSGFLSLPYISFIPTDYPPPGTFITVLFSGFWTVGATVVVYSVYRMHTFMKRKRDQRLDELEAEVRRRVEAPVDTYGEATLGVEGWETLQTEIEQVRSTRTYPFTPAASLRIGIGVLLPQALNLFRLALTTDLSAVVGA